MTWEQTHRRWRAMRAIEEQSTFAWSGELGELFGDPAGLAAHLEQRGRRVRRALDALTASTADETGVDRAVA